MYARASKTKHGKENSRAETQARRKEKRSPHDKQHGRQKGTGKHEGETEGESRARHVARCPLATREKGYWDLDDGGKMRKSLTSDDSKYGRFGRIGKEQKMSIREKDGQSIGMRPPCVDQNYLSLTDGSFS